MERREASCEIIEPSSVPSGTCPMEIPLFMIVKMEFLRGSPVAVSTAVLFQKKNGTPMNTPPIKDGIAGNFIATATITKIGGSRERTLIFDKLLDESRDFIYNRHVNRVVGSMHEAHYCVSN